MDRVLNVRGNVADEKFRRVIAAAQALGFVRDLPEPWKALHRIEVLTPRNPTPFWAALDAAFEVQAKQLPRHVLIQRTRLPQQDIAAWRRAIEGPLGNRHALIVAVDSDADVAVSLDICRRRGEIVISLTSQIADFRVDGHSGIDNFAAGRTAAHLMLPMIQGEGSLLLLPPHDRRAEHRQRVDGFRSVIGDRFKIHVEPTQEDGARLARIVQRHLGRGDLLGIYDSGHDSPEVAEILRNLPERPRWIAHECSELHLRCLRAGLLDFALDQSPQAQALLALHLALSAKSGWEGALSIMPPPPELRIVCRENI